MNNAKIAYDGRVTFWNTKLVTPRNPKPPILRQSPEWEVFSCLPPLAKEKFMSDLGSSHVINSEKTPQAQPERALRGSKGISPYGRSLVRCSAQWLEDTYGLKHLSFLTCTLPPEALAAYTRENFAEIVNRFQKWLRYHLGQAGLCPLILSVTEIQEKRWQAEQGLPPVHLHLLFHGRKVGQSWGFRPSFYQAGWEQSVLSVMDIRCSFQSSVRVEALRSSSVNYLGKYMSKGSKTLNSECLKFMPSAWYNISTKLKDIVKKLEVRFSGASAHDLYEYLYSGDLMMWARSVMSEYTQTGTCYLLAWIGALKSRGIYWDIVSDVKEILNATREFNLAR